MKKAFIILILLTCGATINHAQVRTTYTQAHYSLCLPVGSFSEFNGNLSGRNFNIDTRYFLEDNFSVGFKLGWSVFRDETDGIHTTTIETDNNVIKLSAKKFTFTNTIPILITSHYYLGESVDIKPYVGLGAGVYYLKKRTEMGLYLVEEDGVQIGVNPTVGVIYITDGSVSIGTSVSYHQTFGGDLGTMSFLEFNIGFGWGL